MKRDASIDDVAGALVDAIDLAGHAPFTIALSGGSTPKALYRSLAMSPLIDWKKVELFFGDERPVPPDHADSNYRMVKEALLDHVKVVAHRMPADTGDAEAYARLLPEVFDLVLLGIGQDGHTASLFPGGCAVEETERRVVMNDAAKRVWVLAGPDKADIVARTMGQPGTLPIQRVRPAGEFVWWMVHA
jgi:6-phosphogluconolactonase